MEVRQIELDQERRTALGLEDRTMIAEILRSLPANQRAVLVFVVLDDLPVAEAARSARQEPRSDGVAVVPGAGQLPSSLRRGGSR